MTFSGMNASIQFFDCRLALIHIPLDLYPHFLQPIISLILPTTSPNPINFNFDLTEGDFHFAGSVESDRPREFLNISVTPIECSIVCARRLVEELFTPILENLDPESRDKIKIAEDDYVVLQVEGDGEMGHKLVDLTTPLAMAGISLFFISTYFSDYILVSAKSTSKVTRALQKRGFVFERHADAFVSHRRTSSTPSLNGPPQTPPAISTFEELQLKTFGMLKAQNVVPEVYGDLRLLQMGARRNLSKRRNGRSDDGRLYLGIVQSLIRNPKFLSLTITDKESESLLIEESLLPLFGPHEVLLGDRTDIKIPVIFDLRMFPIESTGIVCGIASRLAGDTVNGMFPLSDPVEIAYLSTARAGTVIVREEEIENAAASLKI